MKRITRISLGVLFVTSTALLGVSALAQPTPPGRRPGGGPPAGVAGLDPIHQLMAKRAGRWSLTKKLSMPGQPPMEATGTATITSILGGRFLREENEGMLFGQPVAAEMLSGYNDEAEAFEITWGWTGANRLISATGTSTDGGKTVHYTSSYDSGKGRKEQLVIDLRVIGDDRFVVTLTSRMPDGTDGPTVETTYTRQE